MIELHLNIISLVANYICVVFVFVKEILLLAVLLLSSTSCNSYGNALLDSTDSNGNKGRGKTELIIAV